MDRELTTKIYELAYHVVPDIEESAVQSEVASIESLITQYGGSIVTSQKPKKIHLSYPIRHFHYAQFGYIEFNGPSAIIQKINGQMKLQTPILRYLVLAKDSVNSKKEVRTLGQQKTRAVRAKTGTAEAKSDKATPETSNQMEKELENVLEKI